MIEKRSYNLYPGTYSVSDPALSYVEILSVDREGTGFEVIYWVDGGPSPSDREVVYRDFEGSLTFRDAGVILTGPDDVFDRTEIINVIFEYA